MEELGNQVMDNIKDFFRLSFAEVRPVDVVRGDSAISPKCGLRRFLSDLMAYRLLNSGSVALLEPEIEGFVQAVTKVEDVASDFMFAQIRYRQGYNERPYNRGGCYYHDHNQTVSC
jgi:hypothetical protein